MSIHNFNFPTPIKFGPGARKLVPAHLKELGYLRPLVVTDQGVARQGFFQAFVAELREGGLQPAVFDGVAGNPVKSQVSKGVERYRNSDGDCLIGIGGGAALDVAKAILVGVSHEHDLFDYEDRPGARAIDQPVPYWVALPTTAGTGSEVGRSAVISDDHSHHKKIIFAPQLLAKLVFADPELTLDLPPHITAATGMDALTHLVEAYLAKDYHPICDGIALEGMRLVQASLVRAVHEGHHMQARADMLLASLMGAVAFQKGLGLVHSCAHALSTVADLHHGLANGIMIEHALPFNAEVVPERFEQMAVTLGLKPSAEAFFDWLHALKAEIGIPARLAALELRSEQIPALADVAIADGCHGSNPRPVSREDFVRIFQEAL
ncbi:MAG: alcohol dehydrogenase [Candidatus Melainabacteria bacterium HGW-Melainabacteria-1]|nr:MAG: alcohol dehydrogenase [Candidatus Melainabacteria bacterium HGW-Melainabacteria-1]